jgi:hypothetical protein
VSSRNAHAYPFYIEVQGGATQYRGTDTLFSSGTTDASSFGMGFNFSFFYSPWEPHGGLDFQLGLQDQWVFASQGANYYGTQAPYGVLRLQFLSAYASVGLTPFVWRRSMNSPGIDMFSQVPNTLAYIGELGVLYSATPKFSLGGSFAMQWFSVGGVLSTQPAATFNVVLRFYFSLFGHDPDGSGKPLEYEGWRYIGK